jgi:hypothetical protein
MMRQLYAIAIEQCDARGQWRPGTIAYLHADSSAHARNQYARSRPPAGTRIVAVGPVIAYHVLDKQGLVLSV